MSQRSWATFFIVTSLVAAISTLALPTTARAAQPTIRWDADGAAEISAPPFLFTLELAEFSNPAEINRRQVIRLDVSAEVDADVCEAPVKVTPVRDGEVIGEPAYLDASDSYGDYVSTWFPVGPAGAYSLQIDATVVTGTPYCSSGPTSSAPYNSVIELFAIGDALPGPASTRPVSITSTGSHTLVANTWSRSRPIRITYAIKDSERRTDLVHSICMTDTSDCWFEDASLRPQGSIRRTSTGWIRTWDFWWERSSPSECVSYYWNQPDVSVILVISNRDGKVIGKKKHTVKLTCRMRARSFPAFHGAARLPRS